MSNNTCPKCNTENPARYHSNDGCKVCARRAALVFYYQAVAMGLPTTPGRARLLKSKTYVTKNPCGRFGHVGIKSIGGKCPKCKRSETSRQKALRLGHTWYKVSLPCKNGHMAFKNVYSGACSECVNTTPREKLGIKKRIETVKCKRGHSGPRYVSNGACIQCVREYDAARRK